MITPLIEKLNITSSVSIVIISISLMLFGGFAMTRITKRLKLPNVTAYIVAGILMGPYCLNLIPVGLIERMDFIADIALAFIAFSTGEFFRFSTLKKSGVKVLLITFLEACLASIAVFTPKYRIKTQGGKQTYGHFDVTSNVRPHCAAPWQLVTGN